MDIDTKRKLQVIIGFFIFTIALIASYFSVVEGNDVLYNDIFLTLDISGSMDDPLKIGSAKNAAMEFVHAVLTNNPNKFRIGLIVFQTQARLVCPLTNDLDILESAISSLSAGGNTAMGDAIKIADETFKTDTRVSVRKTILLMTDGLSNEGMDPIVATESAKINSITIYTVGYGSDADTLIMQRIASMTKGKYFFAMTGSELVKNFSEIAAILISPIAHYGSRTLILVSIPVLLFLPEIEKGVTTIVQKATTTIFGRSKPSISRPSQTIPRRPEIPTKTRPSETLPRVSICPSCEHVNRATAIYCASCGVVLKPTAPVSNFCGKCGHENRPNALFCAKCGHKLRREKR